MPISLPPMTFAYEACIKGLVSAVSVGAYISAVKTTYCVQVSAGDSLVNLKFNSNGHTLPGTPSFGLEDGNGNSIEVDDKGASIVSRLSPSSGTTVTGSTECGCIGLSSNGFSQATANASLSYTVTPTVVSPVFTEFQAELDGSFDAGKFGQVHTKYQAKVELGDPNASVGRWPLLIPEPEVQAALNRDYLLLGTGIVGVLIYFVVAAD